MKWEIDIFVKKTLFKKYKFITNPADMQYSEKKKSLCQYTCAQLSIPPENRRYFWEYWSRSVEQALSRRRSDVNTGIKLAFLGKNLTLCIQYFIQGLTFDSILFLCRDL